MLGDILELAMLRINKKLRKFSDKTGNFKTKWNKFDSLESLDFLTIY